MPSFKQKMDEARGLVKIDLVLRRAKLVNVLSGEIHETDIGIHQGNFIGIGLPVTFFDGHAPGISDQDLNAYYLAGIHTEHECSTVEEARERLRVNYMKEHYGLESAKGLIHL